jgi:hypothetical protein
MSNSTHTNRLRSDSAELTKSPIFLTAKYSGMSLPPLGIKHETYTQKRDSKTIGQLTESSVHCPWNAVVYI